MTEQIFPTSINMSIQTLPTLLELAVQSLLRDETLALSALEYIPMELFPWLFKEAFASRCTKVLSAIVQVWPFPCLPLGALMKASDDLETLRATLDGLDQLLSQEACSRRCRLQVLDLRCAHQSFWQVWAGSLADVCSEETESKRLTREDGPQTGAKQTLKVFIDLPLRPRAFDGFLTYLFLWVEARKGLLQLGCKKLKISTSAMQKNTRILDLLNLDCMEEVEVCCVWKVSTLASFAPYLGQMRNLQKLLLSRIRVPASISPEEEEVSIFQFTSQFLNMDCLQELIMDSVTFLKGRLDQVLWCLKAPLETLCISSSKLSESDLDCLAECPSVHQLSHLTLSGVVLTHLSPEPLRILLERVTGTLKTLDLEDCRMGDSQLRVLLPALSRCSQLATFNYLKNPISVAFLETLLRSTADLSSLTLEMYSTPWEVYGPQGAYYRQRLDQLQEELSSTMKPLEHPKTVWFSVFPCPLTGN